LKVKVERSGGLAGISISNEMDGKDLPSDLIQTAKKIIEDKKSYSLPEKLPPRGAADHYTYKISIQDGANQSVIECNQFTIQDNLKTLVKYIENYSNKRK